MTRSTAPPLGHYIATEGQHVLTQEGAPIYQSETKKTSMMQNRMPGIIFICVNKYVLTQSACVYI